MTVDLFVQLTVCVLLATLAVAWLTGRSATVSNGATAATASTPPSRWKVFRVDPRAFTAPDAPAVEQLDGKLALYADRARDASSRKIRLRDPESRHRIDLKGDLWRPDRRVRVWVDGKERFRLEWLRGSVTAREPQPPHGAVAEIRGDLAGHDWEIRHAGHTVACVYAERDRKESAAVTPGADERFRLEILDEEERLLLVALAAGVEVLCRRNARP